VGFSLLKIVWARQSSNRSHFFQYGVAFNIKFPPYVTGVNMTKLGSKVTYNNSFKDLLTPFFVVFVFA